jgi:hypothetical protein
LIEQLLPKEREYITSYYQPKEKGFARAFTTTYLNLSVHSTQRGEGYHPVVKKHLHKHLTLLKACHYLVEDLCDLMAKHFDRINNDRRSLPTFLDRDAFKDVGKLVTGYCLSKLAMPEWREAKRLGIELEFEDDEDWAAATLSQKAKDTREKAKAAKEAAETQDIPVEVLKDSGCPFHCELPMRQRIPCRHWMLISFKARTPLPLSLFHPRWLLDGPAVVHDRWEMSWKGDKSAEVGQRGDRFSNRGRELLKDSYLGVELALDRLPISDAETLAVSIRDIAALITEKGLDQAERHRRHPLELPERLQQANVRQFPNSRKRAMTGREAADFEALEASRNRRQEALNAQATQNEEDGWRDALRDEQRKRVSQREVEAQAEAEEEAQAAGQDVEREEAVASFETEGEFRVEEDGDSNGDAPTATQRARRALRPSEKVREAKKLQQEREEERGRCGRARRRRPRGAKAQAARNREGSALLDGYEPTLSQYL